MAEVMGAGFPGFFGNFGFLIFLIFILIVFGLPFLGGFVDP